MAMIPDVTPHLTLLYRAEEQRIADLERLGRKLADAGDRRVGHPRSVQGYDASPYRSERVRLANEQVNYLKARRRALHGL